ncbi:MAG: glutamate 5-kinase [Gammaproteobacteria bacterium]|nr:glutamate 5-kinase [Gammaproteobacteria bacterium]MDH3506013.1 glutamate 5-kinase [Gammaproteobacteria bacterium]
MHDDTNTLSGQRLSQARRVVIKIGSALLVDQSSGALHREWLEALCTDVVALREQGKEVILVSSGAVALGARRLEIDVRRSRLPDHQAAAAVGQIQLAHAYEEVLGQFGFTAAQVLLTLDDSESRPRYLNAVNTLFTLLKLGVIPVVNENDTVATQELRYGDNDRLAARVAQMISADCLILLSDVDGLYTADPQTNPDARYIPEVTALTDDYWAMAGGPGSDLASGGMRTKLDAARIALDAGCQMLITSGHIMRPLQALEAGARATWFLPDSTPRAARKQWIAGTLQPKGRLKVDAGAVEALSGGRSLLPAGVTGVEGSFVRGDAVSLLDPHGNELGRGLIAYAADEARAIIGQQSAAIPEILGYRGRDEMIHRDDLVLVRQRPGTST